MLFTKSTFPYIGAQYVDEERTVLPCPFLKIEEKCSNFEKRCLVSVQLWIKFLEYLEEKTPQFFPTGSLNFSFLL